MSRVHRRASEASLLVGALVAAGLWAGCDSEFPAPLSNQGPNTRISAGPPEATDTSYEVNLFWFGWDDDGFVDHYEIAFDDTSTWVSPIFGNDSLFVLAAAETCCVEGLPDYVPPLPDSVYQQYHTFYVRSVDNAGVPDDTPAFRSFNAKTIAPYTEIVEPSPSELGYWGTQVQVHWVGKDDDGLVVSYRYALTTTEDYVRDTGDTTGAAGPIIAWMDTITYFPNFSGGYFTDSLVWHDTVEDSAAFPGVTTTVPPNKILFAVRAIDNAGATERILSRETNTRFFTVTTALDGPRITLTSNVLGTWDTTNPPDVRDVFAGQGIHFRWHAVPGISGAPVAGYSHAVDDTSLWSPWSLLDTEFPEQPVGGPEEFWFPDEGPHTFFVRAIDAGGFLTVLAAKLRVFAGPQFCPANERYILVVLDTDTAALAADSIWPVQGLFRPIERGLAQYWFEGYNFQVHETDAGRDKPTLSLLDCASSLFWFVSTDNRAGRCVFKQYHDAPPNPLPSYVASGGNLFVCGLSPVNATRYIDNTCTGQTLFLNNEPVNFQSTLSDSCVADHWMATQFGIDSINTSISNTNADTQAQNRLRLCKSQLTAGPNPYPDLPFDPLTWPNGPVYRGFGYYDRGIQVLDLGASSAEVIYTANDSNDAIGIRRLTSPGVNGNLVYLGFHPYFVERPAFRQLIRAVLTDFGEFPNP